jgi:manganese/zinc/iron transport system permease protein
MEYLSIFTDYTFRNVILGAAMIGLISGVIGSFVIMKKESMLGDALSHSTLPGIVIAIILFGNQNSVYLFIGAGISAWLANSVILSIIRKSKIKADTALGIVLSVFFGLGIFLLTLFKDNNNAGLAGMQAFMFGEAASIVEKDVNLIISMSIVVLTVIILFFKELKLLIFDTEYFKALGFSVSLMDFVLSILIVIVIVTGLQIVGLILMSALIISPAVAARQLTGNFKYMLILAAFFGIFSGVSGALISSFFSNMPTGPIIIVFAVFLIIVSLIISYILKKVAER